jgi:hypothetical protein
MNQMHKRSIIERNHCVLRRLKSDRCGDRIEIQVTRPIYNTPSMQGTVARIRGRLKIKSAHLLYTVDRASQELLTVKMEVFMKSHVPLGFMSGTPMTLILTHVDEYLQHLNG